MRFSLTKTLLAVVFTLAATGTSANQRNDITSCYDYAGVAEHKQTSPARDLYVLVDQTVRLDVKLKKTVHQQLNAFSKPGDRIFIVTFSALAAGQYTDIQFQGMFDHSMGENVRNSMNRMKLKKFDQCMESQPKALGLINRKLKQSFNDSSIDYPRTELVGSLLNVSSELISRSNAHRKVLLIVSDMLENSDSVSFYSNGRVRAINAETAFDKIQQQGFSGDLNSTEVYVIGAGYVHGAKNYSSQKAVNELENFWRKVITENNGKLKQFGKPQLFSNIQ